MKPSIEVQLYLQENFLDLSLSKLAKEEGFDGICHAFYYGGEGDIMLWDNVRSMDGCKNSNLEGHICSPGYIQILHWFIHGKGLFLGVDIFKEEGKSIEYWGYIIDLKKSTFFSVGDTSRIWCDPVDRDSYLEALQPCINQAFIILKNEKDKGLTSEHQSGGDKSENS